MKLESIMYSIQFNLTQFIMLKAGIKTLPCTKCDHKQNLLCNLRDFIDKMLLFIFVLPDIYKRPQIAL